MGIAIKIGTEAVALLIVFNLTNAFWSLAKMPAVFSDAFANKELVLSAIARNERGEFHNSKVNEIERMRGMRAQVSEPMHFQLLLESYIEASLKAWSRVKWIQLTIAIALTAASWLISPIAALVNALVVLVYGRLFSISSSAVAEALGSFQIVVLIISDWYERYPDECERFCTDKASRFLTMFSQIREPRVSPTF